MCSPDVTNAQPVTPPSPPSCPPCPPAPACPPCNCPAPPTCAPAAPGSGGGGGGVSSPAPPAPPVGPAPRIPSPIRILPPIRFNPRWGEFPFRYRRYLYGLDALDLPINLLNFPPACPMFMRYCMPGEVPTYNRCGASCSGVGPRLILPVSPSTITPPGIIAAPTPGSPASGAPIASGSSSIWWWIGGGVLGLYLISKGR